MEEAWGGSDAGLREEQGGWSWNTPALWVEGEALLGTCR